MPENNNLRNVIVGGIFTLIAACIAGAFLLLNTAFENGFVVVGSGNPPQQEPTSSSENNPPIVSNISKTEYTFSVSASEPWQFTGVEIQTGDYLTIEYVSGEWTGQSSVGGLSGPDYGSEPNNTNSCFPINGEGSSMIGKIGSGQAFKIGYQYFGSEQAGGKLYLRMNDCDNMLSDNKGSITVKITIER